MEIPKEISIFIKGGNEKNNKRKDYFLTTEKILDS